MDGESGEQKDGLGCRILGHLRILENSNSGNVDICINILHIVLSRIKPRNRSFLESNVLFTSMCCSHHVCNLK